MAAENSIGDYDFICLEDMPDLIKHQLELITRSGVDGTGFWMTGVRGEEIEVTSKVDCTNLQGAIALLAEYQALIAEDPQTMVYGGVDLSTVAGVKFKVTNVRPVVLKAITAAVGLKINPPSGAWLEARWTLVPVAYA